MVKRNTVALNLQLSPEASAALRAYAERKKITIRAAVETGIRAITPVKKGKK